MQEARVNQAMSCTVSSPTEEARFCYMDYSSCARRTKKVHTHYHGLDVFFKKDGPQDLWHVRVHEEESGIP